MHYGYIRTLGELRNAVNREMDGAQLHERPSKRLQDAMDAVVFETNKVNVQMDKEEADDSPPG